MVAGAQLVRRAARGLARERRDGPGRQPLGDTSGRLGARRADRRPSRLGLERRLARRLPERARRSRGAAPAGGGRAPAGDGAARRLGRRGRLPVRSQPVRLERRLAEPRPGPVPRPARRLRRSTPRGPRRARGRSRTARDAAGSSPLPPPTWSCTSNRARCSSASTCPSRSYSVRTGSSATSSASPASAPTSGRRRWTCAATPWPRRRASCSRDGASPRRRGASRRSARSRRPEAS